MVLYGTWYLLGVAAIVVIWGIFVAPAERAHHRRRMDLIQKRIRKKEKENEKLRRAEESLDEERTARRIQKKYFRCSRRHK